LEVMDGAVVRAVEAGLATDYTDFHRWPAGDIHLSKRPGSLRDQGGRTGRRGWIPLSG
jgi:hypothetical protein